MNKQLVINKTVVFDVGIDKLWVVLTDPVWTRQYMFDCDVISDWQPGSPVLWINTKDGKTYVKGELIKIVPKELLVFTTFGTNMKIDDIPSNYMTLTYRLLAVGTQAVLVITQGDYAKVANGEKRFLDTIAAWDTVIPRLKKLLHSKSE